MKVIKKVTRSASQRAYQPANNPQSKKLVRLAKFDERIEMLVKELQTSRMGILKSSEEEMLKLVVAFAKTVIKTEPLIQPEIVLKT